MCNKVSVQCSVFNGNDLRRAQMHRYVLEEDPEDTDELGSSAPYIPVENKGRTQVFPPRGVGRV